MQNIFKSFCLLLLAVSVSGCADLTHFNLMHSNYDRQQTLSFIDAKQRVVATSKDASGQMAICAEPSPDALSAIAASQGFSLSNETINAALNNSLAESASSIGIRTQSIQLMRDAMYRLCEAHMSGAIDNLSFETMHRRFQSSMVAILAIEQLTGATRPTPVVLNGSASVGNAELALKATTLTEEARLKRQSAKSALDTFKAGDLKTAQDAYTAKEKEVRVTHKVPDGTELTAEQQKELKTEADALEAAKAKSASLQETYDAADQAFNAAEAARVAAVSSGLSAQTTSVTLAAPVSNALPSESIDKISSAVENIVASTLKLSFSNEVCTTILTDAYRNHLDLIGGVASKCGRLLDSTASLLEAQGHLVAIKNEAAQKIIDGDDVSAVELQKLLEELKGLELPLQPFQGDMLIGGSWSDPDALAEALERILQEQSQ